MASVEDKINELKELLSKSKVNKATEHAVGTMKARLAKLEEQADKRSGSKAGPGYAVKKQGDATVVLIGFPSVGKSTLLNALTGAKSKTADYDFTTLTAIPGMLKHKGASIQVMDVPGIISEASKGKGRGREVISVVRNADLIIILLDAKQTDKLSIIEQELYNANIRLNQEPPRVEIKKTIKGGLIIESIVKQELSDETLKSMLNESGYSNAVVLLKEKVSLDRFVDALSTNRKYVKSFIIINKIDLLSRAGLSKLKKVFPNAVLISARQGLNLDDLRERIWSELEFIRIYPKPPTKSVSKEPIIMRGKPTIADFIRALRYSTDYFNYAQVWGRSARFPGQKVGLKHELKDKDIVTVFFK